MAQSLESRPTVVDFREDSPWVKLAKAHWLDVKVRKVKPDVIKKQLWDPLEAEGFSTRSLLILENLNVLEKFLWPTYTEDASNHHVLLIALIVSVKYREHLPIWDIFSDRGDDFSTLFHRILSMSIDPSLSTHSRMSIISFIIGAFQSLENVLIRKECAPLVAISIWHNLASEDARERVIAKSPMLKKAWKAAGKRFDAGDDATKAKIRFERAWLYTMLLDFLQRLNGSEQSENLLYCERFMELLVDLLSQLPTRRYVNTLLKDLNLLPIISLSQLYREPESALFRDLYNLLRHFVNFAIDDYTGESLSPQAVYDIHCQDLGRLQRTAMKFFREKLMILALSNLGTISQRSELEGQLSSLEDFELQTLCSHLGFRTNYPKSAGITPDRELYTEVLASFYESKPSFQEAISKLNIVPTDADLYNPALLRNETYDGSRPLAIPKLNLQYLSIGDFLWRSFLLYRSEAFFQIRKDMESVVKRMQPRANRDGSVKFEGFSRMAIPISKPAIIEVAQPKVGSPNPAFVRAEIPIEVGRLADHIRKEWEALRPNDVVYLLAVQSTSPAQFGIRDQDAEGPRMTHLRTAEIVQILDDQGRPLRQPATGQSNGYNSRPRIRRLLVNLEASVFKADKDLQAQGKPDIYSLVNVIARRKGRENNFKSILETMQNLIVSDVPLPSWLQDIFLGYGDPAGAQYSRLSNRLQSVDFRDTFLDWSHLVESFPGKTIEPSGAETSRFGPPYVLETVEGEPAPVEVPPKKRRKGQAEQTEQAPSTLRVSTYKPPNRGPYPIDAPKLNTVRFTSAQVEAIASGTQPGLTVIVGPPGTGKTDVATQIINNLYHNFPGERTLLIAHSNQALNQLFQKIIALDIDERHLLRLGHGEEELDTESNYSKHGRVESFLDNRNIYLSEVQRLAGSIQAEGAHGNSCETAGYFNTVYVQPAWTKFWEQAKSDASNEDIITSFPFHGYFSNAPQPLFDASASKESILDIASGCQRHIDRIFAELEDIRPFEILRQPRDKANYLLVKEARVIAMTSTHAAMRRQEIADLGFHYDNVVMEEAAQITEIESFIPSALQNVKSDNSEHPLKRVVLCGDHFQNSPVIQNMAFRQYAHFEHSLFLRLARLGVPVITLDRQGRARPSIAELFRWRYPELGDLPSVETMEEFKLANAGFKFDYQFINVPDYQGEGEREPTPHFIQNLGEAEYAVAMYQYMRLLGYPASKISILATYAGQTALIRDVLIHRCAKNSMFGMPKIVATVDRYQGEQNDYVILSLTRTRTVGYLRDVRRLTVALSRARLGLYILGRREVFESCYELKPAFDLLLARPDKLMLAPGEMFPSTRALDAEIEGTPMESVEHLGQYVFEMTQAKVMALGDGSMIVDEAGPEEDGLVDEDEVMEEDDI